MVCIIWIEEFPSGTPRRFLNSVASFQTTFLPILLSRPSMRQVTSWSVFIVLSVLRNGHKFLTPLWRVSVTSFHQHILFFSFLLSALQQSFLLTLLISPSLPDLARTLAVHRIRWCFEPIETRRIEAISCSSSVGQHQWHKWRRKQHRWAPTTVTLQETYKLKKAWGTSDVCRFFVTGPADVATKPSYFYCRICRQDVSVLTHGHHKI